MALIGILLVAIFNSTVLAVAVNARCAWSYLSISIAWALAQIGIRMPEWAGVM